MTTIRKLEMNRRYENGLKLCKLWGNDFEVIKSYLTRIFAKNTLGITSALQEAPEFRICDIGSGEGTITEHLLSVLLKKRGKSAVPIIIDLIEPDDNAIKKLAIRLERFSFEKGLLLRYHKKPAEVFFHAENTKRKYNFIFASHSFYFINMKLLSQIVESIKSCGFFCVVLGAETSWMSYFKDFFSKQPSVHGGTFIKAFLSLAQKNKWEISRQMIPTRLDLRLMHWKSPNSINNTSKNMMSLILQRNYDDLSLQQKEKVYNEMLPHLKNRNMMLDGDYFLIRRKHV